MYSRRFLNNASVSVKTNSKCIFVFVTHYCLVVLIKSSTTTYGETISKSKNNVGQGQD